MNFTGENLLRDLAPQVLGAVIRRFGDFSAAEDAVQEALLAAAVQWPNEGVPDNPRGWLIQVAARRMTDHLRAELARRRREAIVVMQVPADQQVVPAADSGLGAETDQDDTLILLFMCCHPALTRPSAIALTLRAVGGLTTAEIANAFLVPEATMAQRISRAKQRIKASGVPFRLPTDHERAQRLSAVLHVLYLIFNEGYASSIGPHLQRSDLSNEAIRLIRAVHNLLPDDGDTTTFISRENSAAREKIRQIYLDNHDVFESDFPLVRLWQPTEPPAGERLAEICARVLIMEGENDTPAYKSMTDKLLSIGGATKVVIAGAAHAINLDKPNEFNQAVLDFLSKK